ncbi:Splicing factor U2AF 23 kDa subunit [Histomonas meleagridis]|uniref:Splicing factor U2AF 23 kDa subunit n=1 Tax=Histomonas meleagridis TaxID=135588 RepID=UPI00355981D7|nr:Splicing factor U2AF 23 kDa subunit [Histomonas meleagridis]KAH0803471.1 Splicing factor U2AF 23 kDa subunit [Histomonas meleagridis]
MLPKGVLEIDDNTKQRLIDAVFLDVSIMLMEFGLLDDMVIAGNKSDNLFGNIIAIFHESDAAYAAQMALDGQYYAGRKIHVSLSPVARISSAICYNVLKYKECQIGNKCMFIHPYEPSPNIFNEVFSRSQKSYPACFRNSRKKYLDSPVDALYGRTKYPAQQNF